MHRELYALKYITTQTIPLIPYVPAVESDVAAVVTSHQTNKRKSWSTALWQGNTLCVQE